MALSLQITKPNGAIVNNALTQSKSTVSVLPGDKVRIVDSATGKTPLNLRAKKISDALVVDNLPDGQVVEISNFYSACSPTQPCSMIVDATAAGADATVITQGTQPVALLGNGQSLIYGADPAAASLAPAAAGAGGAASISPLLVVGGLVGIGAIAAAAGGGGGGGGDNGSGPPPPTATAPVISTHNQSANGLTVNGTAAPNTKVFVTLGNGTPHEVTSDASGNWTTTFANTELPAAGGNLALSAYVLDAGGARVPASSGSGNVAVLPQPDPNDTTAPDAPVVTTPAANTTVSSATAADGLTVSGTAEPGSVVTVTWGALTATGQADAQGNWTAHFASPPPDGSTNITATATDASHNQSTASAPIAVLVDTVGPAGTTATVDPLGHVHGTAAADAVQVVVSDGTTSHVATLAADGSFTLPGTAFTAGQALTVTAFDAAGNPGSAASANAPTSVTLPTAGTAVGGAGAQLIVGSSGDDLLIGGSDSGVRNAQFEYWDLRSGIGFGTDTAGGFGVVSIPSQGLALGWESASTGATFHGGAGATPPPASGNALDAWADGNNDSQLMGNYFDNTGGGASVVDIALDDSAGTTHSHHLWNSNWGHHQGGAGISQTIHTVAGEQYALTLTVGNPDASATSFKVYFGAHQIAEFDGETGIWSTAGGMMAPSGFSSPVGAGAQTWTWTVTAEGASSLLNVETFVTPSTTTNDPGINVHGITLAAVQTDGADALVGGAGRDILWGQGGDDILYGGAEGAVDTSGNAFVYSMSSANGADTIRDFQMGTDRIALVDVLDTSGTHLTPADAASASASTTERSDLNLTAADLSQATSSSQYLTVSADAAGNVVIGFQGASGSLGQVTLEGVTVADIGGTASVQALYDHDILVTTTDGFSSRLLDYTSSSALLT